MVRLPGAHNFPSEVAALEAYRRAVRGTFAAVSALELAGEAYETTSVSALGGARRFPYSASLRVLLTSALDWLRASRSMRCISFVVQDECQIERWSEAMNTVLGRTFAVDDAAYADAIAELRARLSEQIEAILLHASEPALRTLLDQIRSALQQAHQPSIQQFGMLGRLAAETISALLCADLGMDAGGNAFGNIERLAKAPIISKWINSYLHSLRVLGNESVHLSEQTRRLPQTLAAGDLVVILSNLLRVLDFYRLWQTERPHLTGS